ncbi:hypothetical protein Btru_057036 [Bulinus truncatus]|nr:hypothetical protein Btru_057036 [Bulinus truncatus]
MRAWKHFELINYRKFSWNICADFKSYWANNGHGFLETENLTTTENWSKKLIKDYEASGANVSLKMNFLHSYIDFFPDNLGGREGGGERWEGEGRREGDGREWEKKEGRKEGREGEGKTQRMSSTSDLVF